MNAVQGIAGGVGKANKDELDFQNDQTALPDDQISQGGYKN